MIWVSTWISTIRHHTWVWQGPSERRTKAQIWLFLRDITNRKSFIMICFEEARILPSLFTPQTWCKGDRIKPILKTTVLLPLTRSVPQQVSYSLTMSSKEDPICLVLWLHLATAQQPLYQVLLLYSPQLVPRFNWLEPVALAQSLPFLVISSCTNLLACLKLSRIIVGLQTIEW